MTAFKLFFNNSANNFVTTSSMGIHEIVKKYVGRAFKSPFSYSVSQSLDCDNVVDVAQMIPTSELSLENVQLVKLAMDVGGVPQVYLLDSHTNCLLGLVSDNLPLKIGEHGVDYWFEEIGKYQMVLGFPADIFAGKVTLLTSTFDALSVA